MRRVKELSSPTTFKPATTESAQAFLAESEKGKAKNDDNNARVRLTTVDSQDNVLFETDYTHPTCLYPIDGVAGALGGLRDVVATVNRSLTRHASCAEGCRNGTNGVRSVSRTPISDGGVMTVAVARGRRGCRSV